ncbi:hypothetical protein [Nocardioides sp. AE5]|uniref:hypothetical protein n=1 Tax=Nocardioides sp. AE5 TaxID=2962573 RepID=UPI002881B8F0|nr:hypothetical protein [Nocardioides sp. AE5]MDT0203010.1 hypothetical protein [Nocardioides sp. AE5]
MNSAQEAPAVSYASYEEFGRDFFAVAVTPERILAAVGQLAGEPIDFGPIGVGPGRIAKVAATGAIGIPTATRADGEAVRISVEIPVDLRLRLDLQMDKQRFEARLTVPIELTARPAHTCVVFIEATPPRPDQVGLALTAGGLRASLVQRVGGMEAEIKRFVAKYVARELEKPTIRAARTIDVGAQIARSWGGVDDAG